MWRITNMSLSISGQNPSTSSLQIDFRSFHQWTTSFFVNKSAIVVVIIQSPANAVHVILCPNFSQSVCQWHRKPTNPPVCTLWIGHLWFSSWQAHVLRMRVNLQGNLVLCTLLFSIYTWIYVHTFLGSVICYHCYNSGTNSFLSWPYKKVNSTFSPTSLLGREKDSE